MKRFVRRVTMVLCAMLLLSCGGRQDQSVDWGAGINDIPDLNGKRVSVLAGSIQEMRIDELCPDAEVLRLNSISEVITAVATEQADYMLVDTSCLIGSGFTEKGLKVQFATDLINGDIAFGLNRENQALCDEFNDFLARYRDDGRLAATNQRWTRGEVQQVVQQHPQLDPDAPVLRVGTNSYFPFSFIQNGVYAGFEPEIVETFAAETGRNVEYVTIDFSGMIASLATGKIDMLASCLTVTPERMQQVLFTNPHYYCASVCVCRSNAAVVKQPFWSRMKESFYNNLVVENRWKLVVDGMWETIIISLCSILLGTIFGGLICWMRLSRKRVLDGIAKVYIEIIRGVPILVLLMLMFYVIFAQSSVSPRWVAIIAFAMNFGAYVSEMFRTGIEGVDRGQTEAGLAMGFSPLKTFFYFVVPQAAKRVIPVFKGEAVSLFKNTSVVGFIAIQDLTKASEIIRARTFDAFFPLIVISIIYFVLAWLFGKALDAAAKGLD